MKKRDYLELFGFILGCEVLGSIGALFTTPAIASWYVFLKKSSLNPPNFVFAPAWTFLFFLMGVSAYLVFRDRKRRKEAGNALCVFAVQFLFNIMWSFLFFGLRSPLLGLVGIFALWVMIVINIYVFWKINKLAGIILLPYLLWVSFASYLNYSVFRLN